MVMEKGRELPAPQTCPVCGGAVPPKRGRGGSPRIYCSELCRTEAHARSNPGWSHGRQVPPGTSGAVSELMASTDLMLKGYHVFRALSPSCPCDLIAFKDGVSLRVEVRSVSLRADGSLSVRARERDDCDVYAFVVPDGTIHYHDAAPGLPPSVRIT